MVFAQESGLLPGETLAEPKIRPITISAFIPDRIPPAIPVLISPGNGHLVTTGRPQFRWYYTADNIGVVKYQLFIDGVLFQDNIPTTTQTTSTYALDYVSLDQIYGLIHALTLADGIHTWKIKAYDTLINNSESATWVFTVDSVAPAFIITKIVDETTSISAQDVSTIPETPLEIPTRNPILQGTGEANAVIVLTVRLPSGATQAHDFTVSSTGTWQVQLTDLPRGEAIYLDFTSTDAVGHVSTLIAVPLIVTPLTLTIPGITTPIEISLPPVLEPLLQPQQMIEKITYSPVIQDLPSSLQTASEALPLILQTPSRNLLKVFLSFIGFILISSLPLAKILMLLARFGRQFSFHLLIEALQAIGLIPAQPAHGIAFAAESQVPLPFATIIFQGKTTAGLFYTLTKVTNKHGMYSYHRLPAGTSQATVLADNCRFPTLLQAKPGTFWADFYRGQPFATDETAWTPSLFLPLDAYTKLQTSLRSWLLQLPARNLVILLSVGGVAMIIPSLCNLLALLVYLASYLNRKWRTAGVELHVVNQAEEPLAQAIVRVQILDEPTLHYLGQTNEQGVVRLRHVPADMTVAITVLKYGYELPTGKSPDTLVTTLTDRTAQLTLLSSLNKL